MFVLGQTGPAQHHVTAGKEEKLNTVPLGCFSVSRSVCGLTLSVRESKTQTTVFYPVPFDPRSVVRLCFIHLFFSACLQVGECA